MTTWIQVWVIVLVLNKSITEMKKKFLYYL